MLRLSLLWGKSKLYYSKGAYGNVFLNQRRHVTYTYQADVLLLERFLYCFPNNVLHFGEVDYCSLKAYAFAPLSSIIEIFTFA